MTRERRADRGRHGAIAQQGKPAPVTAGQRWVIERTNSWMNAYKKLVWWTERRARIVACWLALATVIVRVGRLVREGWRRYRWDDRPTRKP